MRTHGQKGTSLYSTWCTIKTRCSNPRSPDYPRYGGRGIGMWPEWRASFAAFHAYILAHLGERPPGQTLDRIENDRGYEPGNVRWATVAEQTRNRGGRRSNRLVTFEGQALCLADAAKAAGLPITTVYNRLKRGMSDDEALLAFDRRCFNHF